jgi:hypothetical protein
MSEIATQRTSDSDAAMSAFDAVDGSSTRHVSAMDVGAAEAPTIRRSYLSKRSRQSVWILRSRFFQVHGVDAEGNVVIRRVKNLANLEPSRGAVASAFGGKSNRWMETWVFPF